MKKRLTKVAFLTVLVLVVGCGPASQERDTSEPVEIRVAFGAEMLMTDIPQILAHELLTEQGYQVTTTFYSQPELAVEALARDDADIGEGSVPAYWTAISKGADVVSFMEQTANEWQIVAVPEIQTCDDLDGMRLAHHSESSVSKAMTDAYIAEICPGVEPQILYIANSPNRAAAMLAGEIDATPLKLVESMQLEREAPGKFHTLTNFSQDLPRLKTVLLYANRDFADQHPEVVQDYISAMLTVHRQINENPEMLIEEVSERLEVEPELLPEIIQAHLDINTWDVNGGVTEEGVLYSLEFYTSAGNLEPGLATTDVADLSYLEEVLDEMGRE